jgi:hypothetical protein
MTWFDGDPEGLLTKATTVPPVSAVLTGSRASTLLLLLPFDDDEADDSSFLALGLFLYLFFLLVSPLPSPEGVYEIFSGNVGQYLTLFFSFHGLVPTCVAHEPREPHCFLAINTMGSSFPWTVVATFTLPAPSPRIINPLFHYYLIRILNPPTRTACSTQNGSSAKNLTKNKTDPLLKIWDFGSFLEGS